MTHQRHLIEEAQPANRTDERLMDPQMLLQILPPHVGLPANLTTELPLARVYNYVPIQQFLREKSRRANVTFKIPLLQMDRSNMKREMTL